MRAAVNVSGAPYTALDPLPSEVFRQVWLETVFDEFKWDPQIGDVAVLSNFALVLTTDAWRELSGLAERLAAEALAAEAELLSRPDLRARLGLPRPIERLWRRSRTPSVGSDRDVRVVRFDFHDTTEGWQISEANCDTPSGFVEAGGFTRRMAARYPGVRPAGDPAAALARGIAARVTEAARVALIYPTAYVDDRQIMLTIARQLEGHGLRPALINPTQIRWQDGAAVTIADGHEGEIAHLGRFFPAEWMPNLPNGWQHYFDGCRVPASNPTSALLVQSKRFPLVWDDLTTPLPTWRALLPETRPPDVVSGRDGHDWVLKPVFGRAGDGVTIHGVSPDKHWRGARWSARLHPGHWIAQRRFNARPIQIGGVDHYPTIGVFTVDGRAAGMYARIARQPLINDTAADVAVFIPDAADGQSQPGGSMSADK